MTDYEWTADKEKRRQELIDRRNEQGLKVSEWEELGKLNTALAIYNLQAEQAVQ